MEKNERKERALFALKQIGIERLDQFNEKHGSAIYAQLYRQLFAPEDKWSLTIDMVDYLCTKFTRLSYEYIISGIGCWERIKVVTPPTHHQDIHVEQGATAAISQSGTASASSAPATEPAEQRPDIATMVNNGDTGAMCAMLIAQKDEIIRLKDQRIADLERELDFIHHQFSHMFPEVK